MTKNLTYAIFGIIAFVALAGGIYVLKQGQSAPVVTSPSPYPSPLITPSPSPLISPSPTAAVLEVHYGATGFTPTTLRIKAGGTVKFVNDSDSPMWVASNPHPVHTNYLGFDAKRAYTKGESYSFMFNRSGTWEYHNHMRPSDRGTIIVE